MAVRDIYNAVLGTLHASMKPLADGGDAQRVEAIPSDDIPVALTAAQARFAVSAAVVTLTSKLPGAGEEYVYLEVTVADVIWWDDGKDPTVTPGHILAAGFAYRISKSQIPNFKMCRATSVDATCLLSAYKSVA